MGGNNYWIGRQLVGTPCSVLALLALPSSATGENVPPFKSLLRLELVIQVAKAEQDPGWEGIVLLYASHRYHNQHWGKYSTKLLPDAPGRPEERLTK